MPNGLGDNLPRAFIDSLYSYFAPKDYILVQAALTRAVGWKSTWPRKITKHSIKFLRCSGCAQYLSELTKPRRKKSEPTKKKFWDTYCWYIYNDIWPIEEVPFNPEGFCNLNDQKIKGKSYQKCQVKGVSNKKIWDPGHCKKSR